MAEDSDLDDCSILTDDLPPPFKEEITPPTAETAVQVASLLRQKHPKEPGHTPGSKDPVHSSAAPPGGDRVVSPDSRYITPQTPPAAGHPGYVIPQTPPAAGHPGYVTPQTPASTGHPGYVTPQTPTSTGHPGYVTPQTPASTGHPGYVTPQTPASTGHPDISQGQAQQKAGGSHPAPTSPFQGAVGSDQDAPAPSTIRVDGVNMDMDLELLEFYFESPKKSGGDQVTNIVDHRSQGYVLVTFEDPAVVQRVMQRSHKVSNKPLTVGLYQECKEELAEETVGSDQDAPAPSTIRVDGVNMVMDLELLEFYFDSPKNSGGDQITNIVDHRSQGYVLVTFEDPAVVQRVMQRSHTVSKKSLTVSLYREPNKEPAEDLSCTVEVTGGSIALNKEMMELYFENTKKSGGGKTTKIEVMEAARVTLITFEEKRAAEEVVKRPHTVSNTLLRVVPYKPPGPPTKVKVSGLTPKTTDELLLLYFEKAGDVEEVKLDSKKGEAVVTFASPAAVQTVLKQNHKISGKPVTVSLLTTCHYPTKGEGSNLATPETCSVEVKGLDADTNEDTIQFYFENKRRSGGGPVEEFKYKQGSGVAIITFKEAEAAKRVLEKGHIIDNKPLKVRLYSRSASPDASPCSEPQELTMVRVRGLSISTSTDTLANYFENYRRSGGGDVVEVTLDSKTRTFFVTFENPEDAARVTSRPHQLLGKQLEVCLYEPPKMCRDRLVLRNLPEVRTRDELRDFVEVKSKLTVDNILFGEEEGTAVVIFETDVDRQQVQAALTKRPFKGCSLTVDSIPESSTVLVSNLPQNPPVSEDLLMNYFENKRHSGGDEVTNVELGSNAEYALVTFADMEVAARVAGRPHKLQGCPISVGIYMECLGLGGGSEEPTARIPNPLPVSAADCQKLSLLEKLPKLMEAFVASLDNSHAHLELNDVSGSATIACTLTQEMEGVRQMAKSWEEDVAHVLQDHLQTVFAEQLKMTVEEFTEAEDSIIKLIADMSEVAISYNTEQNLLLIVYKGEQLKGLVSTLVTKIKDTQEELDRKKREKTDTVKNSRGKLLLLQKHKVMKNLSEKYPNLVITFREDEGLLELKGLEQEIQGAKIKVLETLNDLKSATHKWDTELHMELLGKDEARKTVESLCSEQLSPDDVLMFTPHGFEVYSFDARRAEMIQVTAVKAVQKRVVRFNDDNKPVVMSQEWANLKRAILTRNEGLMLMDEDESSLTILSISQSIQSDYRSLQDFLQENSVKRHTFPLPQCMHALFRSFLQERVITLQLRMEDFDFDQDCNQVIVSGNKLCIDAAQGIYSRFREMLTVKRKTFTQPSMEEFFKKQEWARKREEIERELKCLVLDPAELPEDFMGFEDAGATGASPFLGHRHDQLPTEEDLFMTSQLGLMPEEPGQGDARKPEADGRLGRHRFTRTRPKRDLDTAARSTNQPKPDLPARPRLYLSVTSDITKEEHDVLINSTNTTLDMSQSQVGKALLEVGGAGIQQELKETYPNGIKMGDIAISGGGKLMCKKLFHCCLPEEKDEEKIQAVVREAVMKCMAQADQLQMGSIGFPSLGTGNLGYPATQVAHTMLEVALDYGRQHPDTVISDVFFILHNDTNLTQVFREEHDKYKQMLRDSQRNKEEEESYLTPVNPSSQGVESYSYFEETRGSAVKVLVGMGQMAVDKAETDLLAAYSDSIGTMKRDVEHLDQWSDLDKETIKNGCKIQCIDLTLNFSLSRLQLRGFKDSLGKIPVHQILKDAEASVSKRQNAALLLQQVQWSFIEVDEDGEHLVPYDMLSNYDIEMAYQDGREKVVLVDSDRVAFVINFSMMDERPEIPDKDKDIEPVRVIRQVKIKSLDIQPPKGWTDMKGQDLDVMPLQPSSTEYSSVADIFMKSLGMPNAQIVKIERIQNLTLYKQYQAMKRQMEDTMPNDRHCERTHLWHGTKSEAVDGINKYGFNRSYSDLKKCAYGQGVYFAASAGYSSRNEYAVADPSTKERNMFMCNVLVGQYTVGSNNMRMPPEISPGGMHYNSTVDDQKNPEIFVTYSDVQAYPEYRIVFRDS